VSLSRPALSIMMIWVSPPALPRAAPLAIEPVIFTVPKLASGKMPPLNVQHGASTMTSAEDRAPRTGSPPWCGSSLGWCLR
jgi:hypothetical protein